MRTWLIPYLRDIRHGIETKGVSRQKNKKQTIKRSLRKEPQMPEALDTKSLEKALIEKKAFIDEGLATAVKVDGDNVQISAEAAASIKSAMADCISGESC